MTFQLGANLYTQGFGSRPENVEVPHYDIRAPTSSDVLYPVGKIWIWINNSIYFLIGSSASQGITTANWIQIANSSGDIISVVGTASQITVTTTLGIATISLPSAITTPGSLTTTTSLSATTSITAGTGITSTTGNIAATAGSVNAGTSMTATLGNITATNGNLVLNTAGNKLVIATGSNASVGTSSAMSGTPGVVTVATTACSATSKVFYARATAGGTLGNVSITAQDGTGFTLTSTGNETSTFNWWIINA